MRPIDSDLLASRPMRLPRPRRPSSPFLLAAIVALPLAAAFVAITGASHALGDVTIVGSTVPATSYDGEHEVRNLDDFFDPQVVRVDPGTTIEWVADGRNPHTVTADDGSFDSGVLSNGQSFEQTYAEPGVYPYFCKLHGAAGGVGMSGTVVVGDVQLPDNNGKGGVGPGREPVPTAPGSTIHVPADAPTIQAGVNLANPGDLILVAPGTYPEAVLVRTPYLTIRGEDRNSVILDGEFKRPNGIHVVEADGVAVENMTARHYQLNGFYWSGVQGYRGSYLTAYGDGDYGIYAYDAVWGRFEHAYASGHPDSGFYIGQCQPCHAVIDDVVSIHNALGYSGTNAGGDLAVVNSEWTGNLAGIAPNTLDSELLAPQRGILVAGNWVHRNAATDAPTKRLEYPTFGIGILIAGGRDNLVQGNLVTDNPTYGIAMLPNLDDNVWATRNNEVRDNVSLRSGRADLALGAPSIKGDCFAGNTFQTSLPPAIQLVAGCDVRIGAGGEPAVTFGLLARFAQALGGHYPSGDWQVEPQPPAQPQMPEPLTAAAAPAVPETVVPGAYVVRPLREIQTGRGPRRVGGGPARHTGR